MNATKKQLVVKLRMDLVVPVRKDSTETANFVYPGAASMLSSVLKMRNVLALLDSAVIAKVVTKENQVELATLLVRSIIVLRTKFAKILIRVSSVNAEMVTKKNPVELVYPTVQIMIATKMQFVVKLKVVSIVTVEKVTLAMVNSVTEVKRFWC